MWFWEFFRSPSGSFSCLIFLKSACSPDGSLCNRAIWTWKSCDYERRLVIQSYRCENVFFLPSVVLWHVNKLLIAPWFLFSRYFKILFLVLMLKSFILEVKFPGWKFCISYCCQLAPKGFEMQGICMISVRWSYGFFNFDNLSNDCVVAFEFGWRLGYYNGVTPAAIRV